jgi:hypothetical protein
VSEYVIECEKSDWCLNLCVVPFCVCVNMLDMCGTMIETVQSRIGATFVCVVALCVFVDMLYMCESML